MLYSTSLRGPVWSALFVLCLCLLSATRLDAQCLEIRPEGGMDFGTLDPGEAQEDDIRIRNRSNDPVTVTAIRFADGTKGFTFVNLPGLPQTLGDGDEIRFDVRATGPNSGGTFIDSVIIESSCNGGTVVLRMNVTQPIVEIADVDFGTVRIGVEVCDSIRICNVSEVAGSAVDFDHNGPNGEWMIKYGLNPENFTVSEQELARLETLELEPGQCATLAVCFRADEPGDYSAVGRFYANTARRKDTTVWRATVLKAGDSSGGGDGGAAPQITSYDFGERWVVGLCSGIPDTVYSATIQLSNTGTAAFEVTSIDLVGPDSAAFAVVSGVAPGDILVPGGGSRGIIVTFRPEDSRRYSASLRVVGRDTISGQALEAIGDFVGFGLASQIDMSGHNFGTVPYEANRRYAATVKIKGQGIRPATITALEIRGDGAAHYSIINAPQMPFVLQMDSTIEIGVEFAPTSPGDWRAQVVAIGDFDRCDSDSTADVWAVAEGTTDVANGRPGAAMHSISPWPNPVTTSATLRFSLSGASHVRIELFSSSGERVAMLADDMFVGGEHDLPLDASVLPAGVYHCRMTGPSGSAETVIVVVR